MINKNAFTIIELVVTIILVSIVTTVSLRSVNKELDKQRHKATWNELISIRKALVGDESAVKNGKRLDFGYIGENDSFPASIAALSDFFPVGSDFQVDGWGNNYTYSNTATAVTVTSLGADNAVGGTGYDADIFITIDKDHYTENNAHVVCHDVGGAILTDTHIDSVTLEAVESGQTYAGTYSNGVWTFADDLPVGTYWVLATVSSTNQWRERLSQGETVLRDGDIMVCIYPNGSTYTHLIDLRFYGSIYQEV